MTRFSPRSTYVLMVSQMRALGDCRFVDMMTSYSSREFAFIDKLRPPNQGIARKSHDRRRLLILAHKVPCPCFMVREFCFAT